MDHSCFMMVQLILLQMNTLGTRKPTFFTSNNQLELVIHGVIVRQSPNNASMMIIIWLVKMLSLYLTGIKSSQNLKLMIFTFLENLMLEFMYHILSTQFIITMLFIQETLTSLNQTWKVWWLEMGAPTGNTILMLHIMRWLTGIHSTQVLFGKKCLTLNVISLVENGVIH